MLSDSSLATTIGSNVSPLGNRSRTLTVFGVSSESGNRYPTPIANASAVGRSRSGGGTTGLSVAHDDGVFLSSVGGDSTTARCGGDGGGVTFIVPPSSPGG